MPFVPRYWCWSLAFFIPNSYRAESMTFILLGTSLSHIADPVVRGLCILKWTWPERDYIALSAERHYISIEVLVLHYWVSITDSTKAEKGYFTTYFSVIYDIRIYNKTSKCIIMIFGSFTSPCLLSYLIDGWWSLIWSFLSAHGTARAHLSN